MKPVSVTTLIHTTLLAGCLSAALFPATAPAKMYKWVDENGKVHYGDRIPPEYAKQERKTLNNQGITVEVKERAKTPEEIAEEQRQAKLAAEEEKRRQEQAAQDRILLDTFGNEDEMVMTRNGKIEAIDAIIRVTNGRIEKLQARIAELTAEAAAMERSGKAVPQRLHDQIARTKQQVAGNEAYIAQKKQEQQAIRTQYEADIARFRTLMEEREQSRQAAEAAATP